MKGIITLDANKVIVSQALSLFLSNNKLKDKGLSDHVFEHVKEAIEKLEPSTYTIETDIHGQFLSFFQEKDDVVSNIMAIFIRLLVSGENMKMVRYNDDMFMIKISGNTIHEKVCDLIKTITNRHTINIKLVIYNNSNDEKEIDNYKIQWLVYSMRKFNMNLSYVVNCISDYNSDNFREALYSLFWFLDADKITKSLNIDGETIASLVQERGLHYLEGHRDYASYALMKI